MMQINQIISSVKGQQIEVYEIYIIVKLTMDSEKELLIFNMKGKFVKNFDTFSAMDPFVKVTIGKSSNRTETIKKGGKEVAWQTAVTVNYFGQTELKFQAFDEDLTENEGIGSAIMKVSDLKVGTNKGQVKTFIQKEQTGLLTFDYILKDMKFSPSILFSNVKCSFVKKTELFIKCSPYFCVSGGSKSAKTEVIKGAEKQLTWNDKIKLTFETPEKFVKLQVLDADSKDKPLFTTLCKIEEFNQLKSHKTVNVTDAGFEYLGVLEFDYETANIVTDKQSADNAKAVADNSNNLTSIKLSTIKSQFLKDGFDPYFKVVLGSNVVRTSVVKKAKKDVQFDDNIKLYAQSKETKINFVAFDKKLVKDEIIGVGQVFISDLKPTTTVPLLNRDGQSKGTITFTADVTKSLGKTLKIIEIKADFKKDVDTFGAMDPFTEVSIGGFIDRTETIDGGGKNVVFKRPVILKFIDEDVIVFKSYDEDVTENQIIGSGELKISELTVEKGEKMINLVNDKKEYAGVLFVSYESTNIVKPSKPLAQSTKDATKVEPPKEKPKEQQKSLPLKDQSKQPSKIDPPKEQSKKQSIDSPSKKESIVDNKKSVVVKKEDPKIDDSPKKTDSNANTSGVKKSQISPKKSEKEIPQIVQKDKAEAENQQNLGSKTSGKAGGIIDEQLQDPSNRQGSLPNASRRLPPVVEKKNFGDRIFQQQSAMTLQKSILSYSVPKAARFHDTVKPVGSEPVYYTDSCFKTDKSKGAGFGYGTRKPYPDWMERNMKENPAPGAYEALPEGDNKKGKTFGISYKHYEKVMIPKEEHKNLRRTNPKLSPLKMKEQQH